MQKRPFNDRHNQNELQSRFKKQMNHWTIKWNHIENPTIHQMWKQK